MAQTPSARRRAGREAFEPHCNPVDFQPYKKGSWPYEMWLKDWLDGWEEAQVAYEAEQKEPKEAQYESTLITQFILFLQINDAWPCSKGIGEEPKQLTPDEVWRLRDAYIAKLTI